MVIRACKQNLLLIFYPLASLFKYFDNAIFYFLEYFLPHIRTQSSLSKGKITQPFGSKMDRI